MFYIQLSHVMYQCCLIPNVQLLHTVFTQKLYMYISRIPDSVLYYVFYMYVVAYINVHWFYNFFTLWFCTMYFGNQSIKSTLW